MGCESPISSHMLYALAFLTGKRGFSIDKKNIISDDTLSSLGVHEVEVKLYKKISATLRINLLEK